jgi:putative membrane protein
MLMFHHGARAFDGHGLWWGFLGGFFPLVLFLALVGLLVWAIMRTTSQRPVPAGTLTPTAPVARPDTALEEVRLRYARGEMSREEFLQRWGDLSGGERQPAGPSRPEPTSPESG